jgi:para-nitrobenzyl esterase
MSDTNNAIVATKSGKIEGFYQQGLYVFKGIPYAAPPIGELRWLPPQPIKPWEGIRKADNFGKIAPQNRGMLDDIIPELATQEPQSEDCLFLNIWSPGLDHERRPVMVWIHGGAFVMGSGSNSAYDGGTLSARGDTVIVTINYRLGPLGFLNLNEITGGKIPATGNEGLLDQISALEWVRENIIAFGGDPDNVTIFGESAGAMSIGCLLAMPKGRGLFRKAILQSGVGNTAVPLEEAIKVSQGFLDTLGLKGTQVNTLQTLTVDRLLSAQKKMLFKIQKQDPGRITVTAPVIDGKTIPEWPLNVIQRGLSGHISAIVGCTLEEWKLFGILDSSLSKLGEAEVFKRCKRFGPTDSVRGLIEAYRNARSRRGADISPLEIFSAIETDFMFRIPGIHVVEALSRFHPNIFNYLFTWKSPVMDGKLGACHALDIGFVFGTHNNNFCGSGDAADTLSGNIQDAWTAFARNGNPSHKSAGDWPPYGDRRVTMVLGNNCHIEEGPYDEERQAWDLLPNAFRG